jgi:hypothetical protein
MEFDLESCLEASCRGNLDQWVSRYLSGDGWANHALRDGLSKHRRYWLGPLRIPLKNLERCCGPEPEMEFRVPEDKWQLKVTRLALALSSPEKLPPLIVEWRAGKLSVRDGNHRHGAMDRAGWAAAWIILWCNDLASYEAASTCVLASPSSLHPRLSKARA